LNKIDTFQNELHWLLEKFLNGMLLSKSSQILYPFSKKIHAESLNRVKSLLEDARDLCTENKINKFDDLIYKFGKRMNLKNVAAIISICYSILDELLTKRKKELTTYTIDIPRIEYHNYNERRLSPILQLHKYIVKYMRDYLFDAFLHGSVSTLDYTYYSDVDTLLIVNKRTILDPAKLIELCKYSIQSHKYLYKFDPLQHHGHFYISEIDLSYYCQEYFPIVLFEYSKSLLESTKVMINVRNSKSEIDRRFSNHIEVLKNNLTCNKYPKKLYHLKVLLSYLMLLPVLFLEKNNYWTYKKFSFDIVSPLFSKECWEPMRIAGKLRRGWNCPSKRIFANVLIQWPNPFLFEIYKKKLGESIPARWRFILSNSFYEDALRLVEEFEEKSNKRIYFETNTD